MHRTPEPEIMDIPARAEAYARADFSAVNTTFLDRLLALTGSRRECRALDLGTGPGDIALRLAHARPSWCVAAIDASLPMLARRAAGNARNPAFILADAKRLPFPDAAFDLAYSNSLLHHLADPLPFWREVRRLTRPGGLVFVRDLFRPPSATDAQRLVDTYAAGEHPLLREDFYNSFLAAFTPEEIREQLVASGLSRLDTTEATDRHVDIFGKPGV